MFQQSILQCRRSILVKSARVGAAISERQKYVDYSKSRMNSITSRDNCHSSFSQGSVYPGLESRRSFHSSTLSEVEQFTLDVKCLVELQENATKKFGDKKCFGTRVGNNFEWISFREFGRLVEKFRNVLAHHKIGKNDKVALISNNRVEWAVAFYAVNSVGGQLVPMYEAQLERDWRYIVTDSDSKMVISANNTIHKVVAQYVGKVGKVQCTLCLDADRSESFSYKHWMDRVESEVPVPPHLPSGDDISTIIYTSGTTGNPKGVELSHTNLMSNIQGINQRMRGELTADRMITGFLPWAHIFGQMCELHCQFAVGSAFAIIEKREQILEGLSIVKPTVMSSVPMLFNRIYDSVNKKISEGSPFSQKVAKMAFATARERNNLLEFGKPVGFLLKLQFAVADKVVLSKIKQKICPTMKYMPSGGAGVSMPVLQFFEDIGIPIVEGYGLTETSPVISTGDNTWKFRRLGCVGVPLHNVTVRILDPETLVERESGQDGEVCVSGGSVMTGYRNNKAANEEVFFYQDGMKFFRSGDLGRIVDKKFLKITGRLKEQFKTENGKYVVPAPLEDFIARSLYVAQALLYGDQRKNCIVIIVPEIAEIKIWALKNHPAIFGPETPSEEFISHPIVRELIASELCNVCAPFKSYERPLSYATILEPFSQENQMLTPKMSLRRNNILKAYSTIIEQMYATPSEGNGSIEVSLGSSIRPVSYATGTIVHPAKADRE